MLSYVEIRYAGVCSVEQYELFKIYKERLKYEQTRISKRRNGKSNEREK